MVYAFLVVILFFNSHILQKRKGTFQHSSFLAGGATSAAGRLEAEKGVLKVNKRLCELMKILSLWIIQDGEDIFSFTTQAIWPHSGHYRPVEENFEQFKSFLVENGVDLAKVKVGNLYFCILTFPISYL